MNEAHEDVPADSAVGAVAPRLGERLGNGHLEGLNAEDDAGVCLLQEGGRGSAEILASSSEEAFVGESREVIIAEDADC
jgi:hypothetical protein